MKNILINNINEEFAGDSIMMIKLYRLLKDKYNITLGVRYYNVYKQIKEQAPEVTIKMYDSLNIINFHIIIGLHMWITNHENHINWIHSNLVEQVGVNSPDLSRFSNYVNLSNVKKVVFVSDVIEKAFEPYMPKEKSVVIPNFVEYISKTPKSYKEPFRVVWVSRFMSEKNWFDLIEAFKNQDIIVDFIGDGKDMMMAKKMKYRDEEAFKNINFLGMLSNEKILQYHKNYTSVFVFSSKAVFESFGLSLLEAMAFGIPCVVIDRDITRYLLGDDGLFYKNSKELRDIALRLKKDKHFYEYYADYSLKRARLFSKEIARERWINLIDSL